MTVKIRPTGAAILAIAATLSGSAGADSACTRRTATNATAQLQTAAEYLALKAGLAVGTRGATSAEIKKVTCFEKWGEHVVLAPVVIRYAGLANHFCRLMVQKNQAATFVTAPIATSADNCKDIERVVYADLNNDGYPDVLLSTVVPSNRYAANVVLPQIYISTKQGEYCYAGLASGALDVNWDGKPGSAASILIAEATRLGLDLMQCTSR